MTDKEKHDIVEYAKMKRHMVVFDNFGIIFMLLNIIIIIVAGMITYFFGPSITKLWTQYGPK